MSKRWHSALAGNFLIILIQCVSNVHLQLAEVALHLTDFPRSGGICDYFVLVFWASPADWAATFIAIVNWDASAAESPGISQLNATVHLLAVGVYWRSFVLEVLGAEAVITSVCLWVHSFAFVIRFALEVAFVKIRLFLILC